MEPEEERLQLIHMSSNHESKELSEIHNCNEERGRKVVGHQNQEPCLDCVICDKSFSSLGNFQIHEKSHEEVFKCGSCPLMFDEECLLLQHEEIHFQIEEINESAQSCKMLASKALLQKHKSKKHRKCSKFRYKCEECGRSFLQKSGLATHLTIHTGEKPFKCEYCAAIFRLNSSLQRHQLKEHVCVKPYVCDECNKNFGHKSDLMHHVRSVHAEERLFICQICNEKFTTNVVLMRHVNIHFELKLNVCKVCGTKFSHSGSLYNHMKVHSSERAFHCKDCGKSYKLKAHLKKHNCNVKRRSRDTQVFKNINGVLS